MKNQDQQKLFEYHKIFSDQIVFSYKGLFDKHIRFVFGNHIETVLSLFPIARERIFRIFIELTQNISFYSIEKNPHAKAHEAGIGTVLIKEYDDFFLLITGNVAQPEDATAVVDKINKINSLTRENLRKFKREKRKLPRGLHGAAHIGLIQSALISGYELKSEKTDVENGMSYLTISVRINKSM